MTEVIEHTCNKQLKCLWASLVTQAVKNLLARQETLVQSLGQDYHLEKGKATDSSILVLKIPWKEEPGGLHSIW